MKVLIMAGGTGGHVFPALAVADVLRAAGHEVVWLGTRTGLEATLVPRANIAMEWITVGGLRGKRLLTLLAAPVTLLRALGQAWRAMRRVKPAVVLGMGGFASGPGGLAAGLLRIPLVIHEQNAVPGVTNRLLAKWARRVLEAFPGSFAPGVRAEHLGNPVRRDIALLPAPAARFAARRGAPRLLVLGGSQGAQALNGTVPAALAQLKGARPEVWHQAGARGLEETRAAYAQHAAGGRVESFIDDMAEAYGWADLVICRAGAMTVAELAAAGVGSVLVPFPAAVDDHQTHNAALLADYGAAVLLPQKEMNPGRLALMLEELLLNRTRLLGMAERARAQARPDAAQRVAGVCLAQAEGGSHHG